MDNRQQQILSEIQELMSSVRSQLEKLDAKMQEFQQLADSQDDTVVPIDIDIDESYLNEEVVIETDLGLPEVQDATYFNLKSPLLFSKTFTFSLSGPLLYIVV